MTKLFKINITEKKEDIWFCGCGIEIWSSGGDPKDFNDEASYPHHEKYFDKENLRDVYVCHKNEFVKTNDYIQSL